MRAAARETAAALGALGAYATTVLPVVRGELGRWRGLAEALPVPDRRAGRLAALEEKRSNVEAVAVFATLSPLRRRRAVLRAIVPLQLAIDYRDSLEERGETVDAAGDSYLAALDAGWLRGCEALPGFAAVAPLLAAAVERCAEGQRRTHAAAAGEGTELRRWAVGLDPSGDFRWWELAAGASSSVAAHALIAAAADPATSAADAAAIDAAYNPSIGALTVLLDDLVDREDDLARSEHNYLIYYRNAKEAADRITMIAGKAVDATSGLPRARRHLAIVEGVTAFYLADPNPGSDYLRKVRIILLAGSRRGSDMLRLLLRLRRAR